MRFPWSSFEIWMVATSGALPLSPLRSVQVMEFADERAGIETRSACTVALSGAARTSGYPGRDAAVLAAPGFDVNAQLPRMSPNVAIAHPNGPLANFVCRCVMNKKLRSLSNTAITPRLPRRIRHQRPCGCVEAEFVTIRPSGQLLEGSDLLVPGREARED